MSMAALLLVLNNGGREHDEIGSQALSCTHAGGTAVKAARADCSKWQKMCKNAGRSIYRVNLSKIGALHLKLWLLFT